MMQNKVIAGLWEKYENLIYNLPLLKRGYSFSALCRIVQADVPVVVVTEQISGAELSWLKKYRDYVCVISVDTAWRLLEDAGLSSDFAMGILGEIDERLSDTAIISNIETDSNGLKQHKGQIFFYYTENELITYLCGEVQKVSDYRYLFNAMEAFAEVRDICDRAIDVAGHMQGADTILLGRQSDRTIGIEECGELYIRCHVREFIRELFPIMDREGAQIFDTQIDALGTEARQMKEVAQEEINLYRRLYAMAMEGNVYQEELDAVVAALNEAGGKLEKSKLSNYVKKLMKQCETWEAEGQRQAENTANEIARIALEELQISEIVHSVYGFLAKAYEHIELDVGEYTDKQPVGKQKQRILIASGTSQYQVIDGFVKELKRAFQELEYEVYQWNLSSGRIGYGHSIYQCMVGYDYIFLMNGVGLEGMIGGGVGCPRFWYENDRSKVAAIFLDHPQMHQKRLQYIKGNVQAIIGDKYDCAYIKKYMPQIQSLQYVVMGGRIQKQIDFEKKENKIVFFGSKAELSQLAEMINSYPYKAAIWRVVDGLLANPKYTVEEMMRQVGRRYHCLSGMESIMLQSNIVYIVQKYVRAYFREKVIRELAASGLPMELYGWKSEEMEQYPNVTQKEAVGYEEMLAICRNTRFVLNVQPWAKDAPQERVFNAMLGGSIAVTDVADLLEAEYEHGENILFYHLEEIEKLPEQIRYYMEHTGEAKALAERGYQITAAAYTSMHYAKKLLQVLDGEKIQ